MPRAYCCSLLLALLAVWHMFAMSINCETVVILPLYLSQYVKETLFCYSSRYQPSRHYCNIVRIVDNFALPWRVDCAMMRHDVCCLTYLQGKNDILCCTVRAMLLLQYSWPFQYWRPVVLRDIVYASSPPDVSNTHLGWSSMINRRDCHSVTWWYDIKCSCYHVVASRHSIILRRAFWYMTLHSYAIQRRYSITCRVLMAAIMTYYWRHSYAARTTCISSYWL